MSIFDTFARLFIVRREPERVEVIEEKEKTVDELQHELQALCDRIVATQRMTVGDTERYERLRLAIYKKGEKPRASIETKSKEKK